MRIIICPTYIHIELLVDTIHITEQSAYLFGREQLVVDILLENPTCSKQHAVLQASDINDMPCVTFTRILFTSVSTSVHGERWEWDGCKVSNLKVRLYLSKSNIQGRT